MVAAVQAIQSPTPVRVLRSTFEDPPFLQQYGHALAGFRREAAGMEWNEEQEYIARKMEEWTPDPDWVLAPSDIGALQGGGNRGARA